MLKNYKVSDFECYTKTALDIFTWVQTSIQINTETYDGRVGH